MQDDSGELRTPCRHMLLNLNGSLQGCGIHWGWNGPWIGSIYEQVTPAASRAETKLVLRRAYGLWQWRWEILCHKPGWCHVACPAAAGPWGLCWMGRKGRDFHGPKAVTFCSRKCPDSFRDVVTAVFERLSNRFFSWDAIALFYLAEQSLVSQP
jgi:hypothetical protein